MTKLTTAELAAWRILVEQYKNQRVVWTPTAVGGCVVGYQIKVDAAIINTTVDEIGSLPSILAAAIDEIERLRKLLHQHHDVGTTGHLEDWGKACPVCKTTQKQVKNDEPS